MGWRWNVFVLLVQFMQLIFVLSGPFGLTGRLVYFCVVFLLEQEWLSRVNVSVQVYMHHFYSVPYIRESTFPPKDVSMHTGHRALTSHSLHDRRYHMGCWDNISIWGEKRRVDASLRRAFRKPNCAKWSEPVPFCAAATGAGMVGEWGQQVWVNNSTSRCSEPGWLSHLQQGKSAFRNSLKVPDGHTGALILLSAN